MERKRLLDHLHTSEQVKWSVLHSSQLRGARVSSERIGASEGSLTVGGGILTVGWKFEEGGPDRNDIFVSGGSSDDESFLTVMGGTFF